MSDKINSEVQKLDSDAIVTLYTLDTTPIGGSEIYRFTAMPNGTGPVIFNGVTYTPIDIEATGFEWDGRGTLPRPKVKVSNVNNIVTAAIITFGDMVGSKFYRVRTFAKHLDDGEDPDPSATFPIEIYTVDQKTKQNKVYVEWQLCSVIDQMGLQIPRRQCVRDVCTHRYRLWDSVSGSFDYTNATCPFTDSVYFDENDESTENPALDKCSKRLTGCRARFSDPKANLPTRAFPGIARTRV